MRQRFNEDRNLYDRLDEVWTRLVDSGTSEAEANERVAALVLGPLDAATDDAVAELLVSAPEFLAEARRWEQEFQEELQASWGEAFDTAYLVIYSVAETADRFTNTHRDAAKAADDDTFRALVQLTDRARRVAWESYRLLTGGFPLGALSRSRTLHEIATVATLLAEDGQRPTPHGLATRYLDHEVIARLKALESDYAAIVARGQTMPPEYDFTELRAERDALVQRYGAGYVGDYGWAAPLSQGGQFGPPFSRLEQLAGRSELRTAYIEASGEVHAGAFGLTLNLEDDGADREPMIGPTTIGLGEPMYLVLASLHHTLWVLLTGGAQTDRPAVRDLLVLKALDRFIDRFVDLAHAAEKQAMDRHQPPD